MTWREQVVVRILLLVARMLADRTWAEEIKHLVTHVQVNAQKESE